MSQQINPAQGSRPDPDELLDRAAREVLDRAIRKGNGDLVIARRWLEYQKRCRRVGGRVRKIHDRALGLLLEKT